MSSYPTADLPPRPKQLRYLRDLAAQRGVSFTPPKTRGQASAQIEALLRRPRDSYSDCRRDREAVSRGLASAGDGARVRDSEVSGYGSSARWS
jgi:hypothetical protein